MAKLQVGDRMPDFSLTLAFEGECSSAEALKQAKHTIFWVLRYMGCTTCRYDIHTLAIAYDKFKAMDTQILVFLQSPTQTVEEETADNRLPFNVVCDPDMLVYQALEIKATETKEERMPKTEEGKRKLAEKKKRVQECGFVHGKYEGNEQQLPAFFVVDPSGVVEYAHYAADSVDMPTAAEALDIIAGLR